MYRLLNQYTPAISPHINKLPVELLQYIFQHHCGFETSPISLLLVCRLWNAIASECSALRGYICYETPPEDRNRPSSTFLRKTQERSLVYTSWTHVIDAAKRASNVPIHLKLVIHTSYDIFNGASTVLLNQCRTLNLHISQDNEHVYRAILASKMSYLEHLNLYLPGHNSIDGLLDHLVVSSPHLCSLTLSTFPHRLKELPILLERIHYLDLLTSPGPNDQGSLLSQLTHLKHLTFQAMFLIPTGSLSHLVSLTITSRTDVIYASPHGFNLPMLTTLALYRHWYCLRGISAPNLKYLRLFSEREAPDAYLTTMIKNILRPTSLTISDDLPVGNLRELLRGIWCDVHELHWKISSHPDSFASLHTRTMAERINNALALCAFLAGGVVEKGSGDVEEGNPLCPQLRCFTLHLIAYGSPTHVDEVAEALRTLTEKRRQHGMQKLESVKCVWSANYRPNHGYDVIDPSHQEWLELE